MKLIRGSWLLLFLSSAVWGAQLPKDAESVGITDFSGGINRQAAPSKLNLNYSPRIVNTLVDEVPGRLTTLGGYEVVFGTSTLGPITMIAQFMRQNEETEYIISDSSLVLTTVDGIEFTRLRSTQNVNQVISWTQAKDKIWFTNGADQVWTYDGSTVTVLDGQTYGGTATPNVPRGNYILYAQDRIFIYNTNANNSSLHFSALTSTDGIAINPDDQRAWPATHELKVDDGNGTAGTALWAYRGGVWIGKKDGIYRLFGIDIDDFNLRKIVADVGPVSNDSVRVLDNYTYFKGALGIYQFDGTDARRISDAFAVDFDDIDSNESNISLVTWSDNADFERGSFVNTEAQNNSIGVIQNQEILTRTATTNYISQTGAGVTTYEKTITFPAPDLDNGTVYFIDHIKANLCYDSIGTAPSSLLMVVDNLQTGVTRGGNNVLQNNVLSCLDPTQIEDNAYLITKNDSDLQSASFTAANVQNGQIRIRIIANEGDMGNTLYLMSNISGSTSPQVGVTLLAPSTGQFISEMATVTVNNNWETFRPQFETNGGNVSFFIRAASAVVNLQNKSWKPIFSGNEIGEPSTHTLIQWASTVTAVAIGSTTPTIDSVVLEYNIGGSNLDRSVGEVWKNRYWLFVSTLTGGTAKMGYLKSRITNPNPIAFVNVIGINVQSLLNTGDSFYAGSSTAGCVLNLDAGTNFNGQAIDAYYETPDLVMENPFFKKEIIRLHLDAQLQTGKILKIGISRDGGAFEESSIDFSGSGRGAKVLNGIGTSGYTYRFRLRNNDLDKDLGINNFMVIYKYTQRDN